MYGSRQALSNPYTGVAAIFLSRLLNHRAPMIFEDGLQSRDLIEVHDVVDAVTLAIEYSGEGVHILNVGTGRPISVSALAQLLARELGVEIPAQVLGRYRSGDIRHCYADTSGQEGTRLRGATSVE